MKKDKWVWMPHAGHFICGNYCRFHLATYVGGYVVSTVGEYFPDSSVRRIFAESRGKEIKGRGDEWDFNYLKEIGYEELGFGRKYETMIFKAKKSPKGEDESCCPWRVIAGEDVDFAGYNDPGSAYKGHLKLCNKWSKK